MKQRTFYLFLLALLISQAGFSQKTGKYGDLKFEEINYGRVVTKNGTIRETKDSPTGKHRWGDNLKLIRTTDSIPIFKNAAFGVIYNIKAKDTIDIDVDVEWIFPKTITNDKGQQFKSIRYTTKRPTNILSASSYTLEERYEMIKGNWILNIYIENKQVYSKTFVLF